MYILHAFLKLAWNDSNKTFAIIIVSVYKQQINSNKSNMLSILELHRFTARLIKKIARTAIKGVIHQYLAIQIYVEVKNTKLN